MADPPRDERLELGTSFPSMSFRSELEDGSHLGGTTRKEFDFLYAQLEGFFRAAGYNANGTLNNLIAQSVTLVNNYNSPLPPGVPAPGSVTIVAADGSTSECCGGGCDTVVIAAGTLAFSGFGDAPIQFVAPDGTVLAQPSYLPNVGATGGGCNGIVALANGRIGVTGGDTGGGSPFTTFVYGPTLATLIGGDNGGLTSSIAWNGAGRFYGYELVVAGNHFIHVFNGSGADIGSFDMGFSVFPNFGSLAVAYDESFGYFIERSFSDTVRQCDMAGGFVNLITKATYSTQGTNALMCLPNGNLLVGWRKVGAAGVVELYDNAGVSQGTYLSLATGDTPMFFTPGLDPSKTFWLSYYSSASTFSSVTVVEVDIATGDVLNQFDPEVGTFDFDSPFCVLRAGISE